jgi:hypothetical protein
VLTFFLGPLLALLPKRWRKSLFASLPVDWRRAAMLSGFGESWAALFAFMHWYSYMMTTWVNRGLDAALDGKTPVGVTDHDIGFTALVILATHPLTWFLAFAGVEGMVRLVSAAVSETNLGILPLFIVDVIIEKTLGGGKPSAARAAGFTEGNVSSYVGTIREKVIFARIPQVPDEHLVTRNGPDEFLEIRSSRRKADWMPPRTVRYQDRYYRLEGHSESMPPRPFHYTLRRLSAGVPGRTVLIYSPEEVPVLAKR